MTHRWRRRVLVAELAATVVIGILIAVCVVFAPLSTGGSGGRSDHWAAWLVPLLALGMVVAGSAWLIRIARSLGEPETRTWRYRP